MFGVEISRAIDEKGVVGWANDDDDLHAEGGARELPSVPSI
jgi:hypothetical protein